MPPRGSCESFWHDHEQINSSTAVAIIIFGFLTFISDHRASAVRLAGALLFLNGGFSFGCHYGFSYSPTLEAAACTLDGSSMLVPGAILLALIADLVLERLYHGSDARRIPGRFRMAMQLLFKGFVMTVIAFVLCLGIIGQHGQLPGAPIYFYATLGVLSLGSVLFALFAIFGLDMLGDHPNASYIKHFMAPMGIVTSIFCSIFMGTIEGACDRAGNVLSRIPAHALFHIGFSYSTYIMMNFLALLHDHVAVPPHSKGHRPETVVHLIPKQPVESLLHKLKRVFFDFLFLLVITDSPHHLRSVTLDSEDGSPLLGSDRSILEVSSV